LRWDWWKYASPIGCRACDEGFVLEEIGIIHNVDYGLSRPPGFVIDKLDGGVFEYVFQPDIVPFSFIEKMYDCGTVAGAVFFKINGFPMISKRKDGYHDSHDMLHSHLWKDAAQT